MPGHNFLFLLRFNSDRIWNMSLGFFGLFLLLLLNVGQCSSKSLDIIFKINEEIPINTIVGDLSNFFLENEKDFTFGFGMEENKNTAYFRIDNESRNLRTVKRIDRETLCDPETVECELSMKLIKYSSSKIFKELYTLKVVVMDINDNAPFFDSSIMSREIVENLPLNSIIHLKGAKDRDVGVNKVKFYELLHENDKFDLKFENNGILVGLILKGELDREKTDFYKLTLIAKDNGHPQKSGSVIVHLTVKDVNDNKPIFTNDSYSVDVYENVAVSSVILVLSAKDADAAENGKVGYRFLYSIQQNVKEMFSISENSGEITVKGNIDYEKKSKYTFKVVGFDYGVYPQSSIVSVNVNILNIDDNPPDISIYYVSDNVSESDKIGDTIARISVSDKDGDDVNCSLSDPHFALNADLNGIMIAKQLDYEDNPVYNVSIICSGDGEPQLQRNKSFLVYIHDENDNPPVFKNPILVSQLENHDFQEFQVVAEDRDSGVNAEVSYKLLNDSVSSLFNITSPTGRITTNVQFNREETPEFEFKVLAIDKGKPPLTGTATIVLRIDDVNDETPTFGKDYYEFRVKEGEVSSTLVGNVKARDLDIKENARLFYWVSNGNESTEYFYVDQGILKTKKKLIYSKNLRYDFTVFVSDHGRPPLSSWANVTVFVDDINDHRPHFVYPNTRNNSISILYDMMGTNKVIANIKARDEDYGVNAHLSYFLKKPQDSPDLFRINHSSGEIRLIKNEKVKVKREAIRLSIVVQDHGEPMLESSSIFVVRVDFANYSSTSGHVEQEDVNRQIGIILGTVTACLFASVILVVCIVRKIDRNRRNYPTRKFENIAMAKSLNRTNKSQVSLNMETTDVPSSPQHEQTESEVLNKTEEEEEKEKEKETDECLTDQETEQQKDSLNQISLQGSCAALL